MHLAHLFVQKSQGAKALIETKAQHTCYAETCLCRCGQERLAGQPCGSTGARCWWAPCNDTGQRCVPRRSECALVACRQRLRVMQGPHTHSPPLPALLDSHCCTATDALHQSISGGRHTFLQRNSPCICQVVTAQPDMTLICNIN